MAKIKTILKELHSAMESGDFTKFLQLVKSDPKCLRNKFGESGITLLHYMCAINIDDLKYKQSLSHILEDANVSADDQNERKVFVADQAQYNKVIEKLIDDFDLDVNARDGDGNTPMHYAVDKNNKSIVDLLLEYEGIDVDYTNKYGISPIKIASRHGYIDIELKLLEESEQFSEDIVPVGETVKDIQRKEKHRIIGLGAIRKLEVGKLPSTIEAIESVTHIENPEIRSKFCVLLRDANKSEVLQQMLKMMAVCSVRGTTSEIRRVTLFGRKNELTAAKKSAASSELEVYEAALINIEKELGKRFKIICADAEDTSSLKIFLQDPQGLYSNKNTIFAATKGLDANEVFAVVMHESAHFIFTQLFKNNAKPYPNDVYANSLKDQYTKIVAKTRDGMKVIESGISSELEMSVYRVIESVYKAYSEDKWDEELIVRVPQILALVGAEKGNIWLNKNVPELYAYYQREINPLISAYLQDMKADMHISDIQFKLGLNLSSDKM